MLKSEVNEYKILRTMAIGLVEAMTRDERVTITPQLFDVLTEWIGLPHVARDPIVAQFIADLNERGNAE